MCVYVVFMSWETQPRAACMPHGQHTTLTACNDIFFQELSSEPSSATMNGFFARLVDFENIPMLCVYVMGYTAQGRKQPRNLMPRCYDPHCLQRHSFLMGVYVMGYTAQGRKQPRNLMPRCYDPHCLQRHLFHTHTYLGRFAKIYGYTYA
jgi:hypothetical protein